MACLYIKASVSQDRSWCTTGFAAGLVGGGSKYFTNYSKKSIGDDISVVKCISTKINVYFWNNSPLTILYAGLIFFRMAPVSV